MAKKKVAKTRQPQDLTSRNNNARKKEIAALRAELTRLTNVFITAIGWITNSAVSPLSQENAVELVEMLGEK